MNRLEKKCVLAAAAFHLLLLLRFARRPCIFVVA
jgi:hypothetical protein